jgi:hypothetical protein
VLSGAFPRIHKAPANGKIKRCNLLGFSVLRHSEEPKKMVGRAGFEPAYSMRADLQSAAFNHSATYPVPHVRGGILGFTVSADKQKEGFLWLFSRRPHNSWNFSFASP